KTPVRAGAVHQASQAMLLKCGEPALDRLRFARLVQAMAGHGMGALTGGNRAQGGSGLAQIGAGIVIPRSLEFGAFVDGQAEGAAWHGMAPIGPQGQWASPQPTTARISCETPLAGF